jgi:hypothetical protein
MMKNHGPREAKTERISVLFWYNLSITHCSTEHFSSLHPRKKLLPARHSSPADVAFGFSYCLGS